MSLTKYQLVVLICIGICSHLIGQEEKEDCWICKDQIHVSEMPYRDFTFESEWPYIAANATVLVANLFIDRAEAFSVNEINALDPSTVNGFDRFATRRFSNSAATASDWFRTGVLILPAIFLSNHHTKQDFVPLVIMSLEGALFNIGITELAKKLVQRTRPFLYNPEAPLDKKTTTNGRVSFFSGHTSHTAAFSFFIAKVMTDYHPDIKPGLKVAIWSVSATIPAVTAFLRVQAGKHFPSDVIAGYVVGGFLGFIIPHLHKKGNRNRRTKFRFGPATSMAGVSFRVQF